MINNDFRIDENELQLEEIIKNDITEYAKETFIRAFPDYKDGLKTIAKRILYIMHKNNITSFTKCATVVGNIMGIHPHGDSAIYGALIVMAQPWKLLSHPYIDIQGNYGSFAGDPPAAMRYPECKLSNFAKDVITSELDNFSVDYKETEMMDGNIEPEYLPSKIPLLLLQGTYGIGEAFTSSIPSHNLRDVCELTEKVIRNVNIPNEELVKNLYPDFSVGGVILNPEEVNESYINGRNCTIKVMANNIKIDQENNQIVINGLPPFGSSFINIKLAIIRIKKSKSDISFDNIIAVNDDTKNLEDHEFKTIIECRKNSNLVEIAESLQNLFTNSRTTSWIYEKNGFPINVKVKDIILDWLEIRRSTKKRKFTRIISKRSNEKHILEGLLECYNKIDEIINICKTSPDKKSVIIKLMKRFHFTYVQASGIGNMSLFSLTKVSLSDLKDKIEKIKKELELKNKELLNIDNLIIQDIREIVRKYGRDRRTKLLFKDNRNINDGPKQGVILTANNSIMIGRYKYLAETRSLIQGLTFFINENKEKFKIVTDSNQFINSFTKLLAFTKNGYYLIKKEEFPMENIWKTICNESIIKTLPLDINNKIMIFGNNKIKLTSLEIFDTNKKSIKLNNIIDKIESVDKDDDIILFIDNDFNFLLTDITEIPLLNSRNSTGVNFNNFDNKLMMRSFNSKLNDCLILSCTNKDSADTKGYLISLNLNDILSRKGKRSHKPKRLIKDSFLRLNSVSILPKNKENHYIILSNYKTMNMNGNVFTRIKDVPKSINLVPINIISI